ncbi:hypothetical protein ACFLSJ_06700 [Verrucomicrobiota bacterium]
MTEHLNNTVDGGGALSAASPSSVLPNGLRTAPPLYSEEELDAVAVRYASKAATCIRALSGKRFDLGRLAFDMHREVMDGAKRVPDNEDTYKRLARKLKSGGIYKASDKRLRSYARAHEVREELGGKGTAPDLPVDHYVEVAHKALGPEGRRELLGIAAEKKLAAPALRKLVKAKLKQLDPDASQVTADDWPDKVDKLVTKAVSAIVEAYGTTADLRVDLPEHIRARIEHLSVLTYQFAHYHPDGEEAKEGTA